jgi:hypothetical protein
MSPVGLASDLPAGRLARFLFFIGFAVAVIVFFNLTPLLDGLGTTATGFGRPVMSPVSAQRYRHTSADRSKTQKREAASQTMQFPGRSDPLIRGSNQHLRPFHLQCKRTGLEPALGPSLSDQKPRYDPSCISSPVS